MNSRPRLHSCSLYTLWLGSRANAAWRNHQHWRREAARAAPSFLIISLSSALLQSFWYVLPGSIQSHLLEYVRLLCLWGMGPASPFKEDRTETWREQNIFQNSAPDAFLPGFLRDHPPYTAVQVGGEGAGDYPWPCGSVSRGTYMKLELLPEDVFILNGHLPSLFFEYLYD